MSLDSEKFKVPTSYPALYDRFGFYINQLLAQASAAHSDRPDFKFEDLQLFVRVRLIETKFLDRFQKYYAERDHLVTEVNFRNYLSRAVFNHNASFIVQLDRKGTISQDQVSASAVSTFADQVTGIVARMGALSLDTPIREILAVNRGWLTALTTFQANRNFSSEHTAFVSKVVESPEYLNYRAIVRDMRSVPFPLPLLDLTHWLIGYPSHTKGVRLHPSDWRLVYKFKRDRLRMDNSAPKANRFHLTLDDGQTALIIQDATVHEGHIGN